MKKLGRLYLLLCWAFFILVLLTAPMKTGLEYSFTWYDKIAHALLFGILAYLLIYYLVLFPRLNFKIAILISIILSVIYSALTEYLQLYIPGRSMSELDLLAGVIGIFIAALAGYEKYEKK
jgi:VanZ family protein